MSTDQSPPNADAPESSNRAQIAAVVVSMLAQKDLFQARARAWLSSQEFTRTYNALHPGLLFKAIATVLGKGKSFLRASPKLYTAYQQLATDGELRFGSAVVMNAAASDNPYFPCPGAAIVANDQDGASVVGATILSFKLAEIYHAEGATDMPRCHEILIDDVYRPLRQRNLPSEETGFAATVFDFRASAAELLLDPDSYPFIPILVNPKGGPFLVIPWAVLHGRPVPVRPTTTTSQAGGPPPLPKTPPQFPSTPPPLPRPQVANDSSAEEVTPRGSTIHRHKAVKGNQFAVVDMSESSVEAISGHIEHYFGKIGSVFHELVSDRVHIDVHFVPPSQGRPYHTLVTSGMSDLQMTVPPGAEEFRHAELMLCLPADWNLGKGDPASSDSAAFNDERNYWPIRTLKKLARFPHEYGTWLGPAHTIPNGNPAEPVADGSPFTGFLIWSPASTPEGFQKLQISSDKTIHFYAVLPLTNAEMDFKLAHGVDALIERLAASGVSELVDPKRAGCV